MKKILISIFSVLLVIFAFSAMVAHADNIFTDFELFNTGTINGQFGWTANSTIDQEIVDQLIQPASTSANRSLRISNGASATDGYVMSKPLINPAGEIGADMGTITTGLMQPHFEAEWDFASANPNGYQSNLTIYASAERGGDVIPTGGFSYSMAKVYMGDCSAGSACSLQDLAAIRPSVDGLIVIYNDPNADNANIIIAQGLDRTVPHHIKLTMDFVSGQNNDVVSVCVDKTTCVNNLTSGEGFNRSNHGNTQVVRAIALTQAGYSPVSLNQGFYIDNFSMLSSGNEPTPTPQPTVAPSPSPSVTPTPVPPPDDSGDCKKDRWMFFNRPFFKNQGQCVKYVQWHRIKRFEKRWEKWEDFRDKYDDVD